MGDHVFLIVGGLLLLALFGVSLVLRARLFGLRAMGGAAELGLVAAIVVSCSLVIYGHFMVGELCYAYIDIGSDTINQYIPFYRYVTDALREGHMSWWVPSFGLGANLFAFQSWVFDPFNLVLIPSLLVLGDASLSVMLVVTQIVRMVCSALLFDLLLRHFCASPGPRVLGACLYGLNGFLVLWGQHYWFGTVCVLLAFVLLQYERVLEHAQPARVVTCGLGVFMLFGWSFYCGYMCLFLCVVYCVLRAVALDEGGARDVLRRLAPAAFATVCGVLMAAVVLVPVGEQLLVESSRVTGVQASLAERVVSAAITWVAPVDLLVSLGRLMANNLLVAQHGMMLDVCSTNYYELVEVGLSSGVFVLCSLLWSCRKDFNARTRVCMVVAAALVVLYCANDLLPWMLYAMASKAYRSSFLLVVPLALGMSVGLDRWLTLERERRPLGAATIATLVTVALLAWTLVYCLGEGARVGTLACLACLGSLLASYVCLALLSFGIVPFGAGVSLVACLLACVLADDYLSCNARQCLDVTQVPRISEEQRDADTMQALAWIAQSDGQTCRVEKTYVDWIPAHNDALVQGYQGTAYYNSVTDSDALGFFERLWPQAQDTYTRVWPEQDLDRPDLLSYLGVKYVLSHEELPYPWLREVARFGGVVVYQNDEFTSFGTAYADFMDEDELPRSASAWRDIMQRVLVADEDASYLAEAGLALGDARVDLAWTRSDAMAGEVACDAPCVVSVPIPFTAGWSARVDGMPVELVRTNLGFLGFMLDAGTHRVELSYAPFGMGVGALISLAGAALLVSGAWLVGRQDRRDARMPKGAHFAS